MVLRRLDKIRIKRSNLRMSKKLKIERGDGKTLEGARLFVAFGIGMEVDCEDELLHLGLI